MRYLLTTLLLTSILVYADTISLKKGKVLSGVEVIKDTYSEVYYRADSASTPQKVAPQNIEWIEYGDAPQEYSDGRYALNLGSYEEALQLLRQALLVAKDTPGMRNWIYPYTHFYLGSTMHKWADNSTFDAKKYEEAVQFYKKTGEIFAQSRLVLACHLHIAQCFLRLQNFNAAKESLRTLQNLSEESNNTEWKGRSLLWQGNVALEERMYGSAITKYREVEQLMESKELEPLRTEASLAIGNCYIAQKDFTSATQHFQKLKANTASANNVDLLAGANNGLGMCFFEQGEITKARQLFIESIIQYPGAKSEQARALFWAGECYLKRSHKEAGSLARAKVYFQLTKQGHPQSEWAPKAMRRLLKINEGEE